MVDTARYSTFYCGNKDKKDPSRRRSEIRETASNQQFGPADARYHLGEASEVLIEVPRSRGIDVYVFGGPSMRLAVQRYNLFSGGGAVPPRWALGFWYRCHGQFDENQVLSMADHFRERDIPCDVMGLEPGWQTHAYSCSYVWSQKFPDPRGMISRLRSKNYRVNLWEHAFVHRTSAIRGALTPLSADYEVWDGLVPDFLNAKARQIFGDLHEREHVALGVAGYKLDECDNSDFTRNWSFPEISRFPSGADGEQMHCVFGQRYMDALQEVFDRRKTDTFGLVRSSGALAAPYPYALYSDLYDHADFIRGLVNSGFSGLLWCPEVRDAGDPEELIRRLQTTILSPVAMVNAWYIRNPPWKQVNSEKNNRGEFAEHFENLETICRELIQLRMQLIPYLHAAFVRYGTEGIPPFRALVMDHPDDSRTWKVDDQFFVGEDLLVAPVTAGMAERDVYLPAGEWFDFYTGRRREGNQTIRVTPPLAQIPMFVKAGSLLPLGRIVQYAEDPANLQLTVRVYGDGGRGAVLYDDENRRIELKWDAVQRAGTLSGASSAYSVGDWIQI